MARLTVRGRLTLVYAAVFAVGGLLLLGLNYAIVSGSLAERGSSAILARTTPDPSLTVWPTPRATRAIVFASTEALDDYRAAVLSDMLLQSSLVLVGAIGLAVLAGRVIAGRTLARLHHITATARELSERDLNRRLALDGPQDELKELGDTFDAMLGRLQDAFDSQRRFAANASHELRTPLAIQRAAVEVPLTTGQVPAHLLPAMNRVLDASQRSERLIAGLLLLACGERGLAETRPVTLSQVVRQACEMLPDDHDVDVRLRLGPGQVDGDPVLLEHLVRNLLDNAVRYNVPGGRVAVTTGTGPSGTEVTVTNTGPRMAADQTAGLFLPFHRGNGQRLSRADGSGLGLSIVRSIADAHRATATAIPGPDGGLVVTVTFPA
ncbi:ATP-binding protein [Streptosporangium sp. KLBMP 9127]|nr:ATP-binding protein [Streptosporangium sp. KLBMP 9127]